MTRGSTTHYFGLKIRIISKAKCRYEGIFYCFNDDDYTIALSSVRALGTEDRKVERFLAHRDEVYTYIVFKIGDITDIEIVETMMIENFESLEDNEVPNVKSVSYIYVRFNRKRKKKWDKKWVAKSAIKGAEVGSDALWQKS